MTGPDEAIDFVLIILLVNLYFNFFFYDRHEEICLLKIITSRKLCKK